MINTFRALGALILVLFLAFPSPAHAQDSDWRERRTDHFAILYIGDDDATAEQYAGFVDSIYNEMSAIFGHRPAEPVTLRLYPSLERYYEANPLARGMDGIVAHADFRRNEVVVIIPQTRLQTPDEVQNNIRHELTHIIATDISENRLNVGFQEGLAQYVERPSRELETRVSLLHRAFDQDQLLPWSDLDDRNAVYQNPDVGYPESLSVVAFLVERYSFAKMRDFLSISARSSGYRSSLERTFGVAPDELEHQWREWLPGYLSGGYRLNALTAYDLSPIKALVEQGRYAEAQGELETAIKWLSTTNQTTTLNEAESLLDLSKAGQQADGLARQSRDALEKADYANAATLVAQAQQAYARIGDERQRDVLAEYASRAERGQRAADILTHAEQLASAPPLTRLLHYPEGRAVADQAVAEYLALGDQARAARAVELRSLFDQGQSLGGGLLLILGLGGITMSIARRLLVREAEAW